MALLSLSDEKIERDSVLPKITPPKKTQNFEQYYLPGSRLSALHLQLHFFLLVAICPPGIFIPIGKVQTPKQNEAVCPSLPRYKS